MAEDRETDRKLAANHKCQRVNEDEEARLAINCDHKMKQRVAEDEDKMPTIGMASTWFLDTDVSLLAQQNIADRESLNSVTTPTFIMGTLGLNLEESCWKTSANSGWCFNSFLIFIIRTIAACHM